MRIAPIFITVIIIAIILFCWQATFNAELPIAADRFGQFGDFLNPIISAITLYLIYREFVHNKKPNLFVLNQTIDFSKTSDDKYLEVVNVGKYHALKIAVEWQYDTKKIDTFLAKQEYRKISEKDFYPDNKEYSEADFANGTKDEFPILECKTDTSVKVKIPKYVTVYLVKKICDLNGQGKVNLLNDDLFSPEITKDVRLKLSYYDVDNDRYEKTFDFLLRNEFTRVTLLAKEN